MIVALELSTTVLAIMAILVVLPHLFHHQPWFNYKDESDA